MKKIAFGCLGLISIFILCTILFVVFGAVETTANNGASETSTSLGIVFILGCVLTILLFRKLLKKDKKTLTKNKDKLAESFIDKKGNKVFQFFINDVSSHFIEKFKTNPNINAGVHYNDNSSQVDVLVNDVNIGFIDKDDFKKTLKYFNNQKYIVDYKITLSEFNNEDRLAFSILVIESKIHLPEIKPEHQEDSVYAKDFKNSDFMEMKSNKFPSKYLKPIKDLPDNGNFFYKKKVVITGGLENFPFREPLAKKLWELGADLDSNIGKYTEIAIVGSYNVGPKKMEKILSQNIRIIREDELLKLLGYDN